MDWWDAVFRIGAGVLAGIVVNVCVLYAIDGVKRWRKASKAIDEMVAGSAAINAQTADMIEELRRQSDALKTAVSVNTEADEWSVDIATDTEETTVPAVYMAAPGPVNVGDLVNGVGVDGTPVPFGMALEPATAAGQVIQVQTSGPAAVSVAAEPDLPVIPLDTIRSADMQVTQDALDVTTWGTVGPTYVSGRRRELVRLTCVYTNALASAHGSSEVLLNGRRMILERSSVNASLLNEQITIEFDLRPAAGMSASLSSVWWSTIATSPTAAQASAAFGQMSVAGQDAATALQQLGESMASFETVYTAVGPRVRRTVPRAPKAPEPEPTIRPTGRRFDLEDE